MSLKKLNNNINNNQQITDQRLFRTFLAQKSHRPPRTVALGTAIFKANMKCNNSKCIPSTPSARTSPSDTFLFHKNVNCSRATI
jgi:hypothetical protein